ncbi:MAG: Secretion system C-terminal sorting domain, partial [Bacteroidota bacterium]
PNPTQSYVNVKVDSKLVGSNYAVYDQTGKSLLKGKISESTTILLGNLSEGIYWLRIEGSSAQMFILKKE